MQGTDLTTHYFTRSGNDINSIMTHALMRQGLNFFRYLKLNKNGSRIHLCNNSEWTSHFYEQGLYKVAWFDKYVPSYHKNNRFIWDEKRLTNDNIVGIHARTVFNINHGYSVIRSYQDYCEVFDFATTDDNIAVNDMYMHNPESIDDIIFYFKDNARSIILEAEKCKISLPMESRLLDHNANAHVPQNPGISKYFIATDNGETYLTKREYDCLSLWFCGKTAKQIAQILGVSFRTVETHLENVKGKFNMHLKDELFTQLQSLGLFESLVKNGLRLYREFEV